MEICRNYSRLGGSSGCLHLAQLVSLLPASIREIEFADATELGPLDHLTLRDSIQSMRWTLSSGQMNGGDWNHSLARMHLPAALTSLQLPATYSHGLPPLPAGLLKLDLARATGEVALPDSLQDLRIDSARIPLLPASLQSLRFGPAFNEPVAALLWPASLTLIEFGDRFNHEIEAVHWPLGLLSLQLGRAFDRPVKRCNCQTHSRTCASARKFTMGHLINRSRDCDYRRLSRASPWLHRSINPLLMSCCPQDSRAWYLAAN